MASPQKPRIAVLTLHPYNYGGVLAVLKTVYQFCQRYFEPTVFFASFDRALSRSLRNPLHRPYLRQCTYFDMNCVEVGTQWALWEPGHYTWTKDLWESALSGYDYFFVVSGTAIAAHPLTLLHKKYVLWAATPYDDDRAERIKTLSFPHALIDYMAKKSMHSIEQTIIQRAAAVGAMSRYAQQAFKGLVRGNGEHILHIGYPIAMPEQSTASEPRAEKMILAAGRFSDPRKNSELLLTVFEKMYAHDPNITLVVAGERPSAEICARHAENPAFKAIRFVGHVSDKDLHALYEQASVFLITSHQEGLGIVGLEALAHGVPVVSTNCGGPRDFVLNNTTGFLVPIDNADAMAQAALNIIHDDALRTQLGANGREYIATHATPEIVHSGFKQMLCMAYPELHAQFVQASFS